MGAPEAPNDGLLPASPAYSSDSGVAKKMRNFSDASSSEGTYKCLFVTGLSNGKY